MEKTILRLSEFHKELESLQKALAISEIKKGGNEFEYFRDSVTQRFEYTIEGAWKLMKSILNEREGMECLSPKECIKTAFRLGYIEEIEIWFNMIETRNLTSHMYNEKYSDQLYSKVIVYNTFLKKFLEKVNDKLG